MRYAWFGYSKGFQPALAKSKTSVTMNKILPNGLTKALPPSKEVCNLLTNICPHAACLLINECVCFYYHLTLFVRNKLIYRDFKSVRCVQSILHTPCIHLTHHTPLPCCRFGRMRWVLRHRDVEKFVAPTDFSVPLCRNIALPCLCRVAACGACRLRGLRAVCAGCVQVALAASYTKQSVDSQ